jgi:17beta-estradiol 17-dehydrogenase / 3beta-hydroxysteroid 3-dehydrogenase
MGRTAAVTGAASGIGQAATKRLLSEGWTVFGLDVSENQLRATSSDLRFKPIVCDVADATRVVAAFADIGFASATLDA